MALLQQILRMVGRDRPGSDPSMSRLSMACEVCLRILTSFLSISYLVESCQPTPPGDMSIDVGGSASIVKLTCVVCCILGRPVEGHTEKEHRPIAINLHVTPQSDDRTACGPNANYEGLSAYESLLVIVGAFPAGMRLGLFVDGKISTVQNHVQSQLPSSFFRHEHGFFASLYPDGFAKPGICLTKTPQGSQCL